MGRDLVTRPYGRFYYLPAMLSKSGHDIWLALLDYKMSTLHHSEQGNLHISSHSLTDLPRYMKHLNDICVQHAPDYIIGFSDTYYGILADYLGRKHNIKVLIDAYDNYESYIPWFKPLHWLWRRSLSRVEIVTAAGPALADLMQKHRPSLTTCIIPMSADPEFEDIPEKPACRSRLKLPMDKKLVGYCGGIHNNRGMNQLFEALDIIHATSPDIEFVFSGRLFPDIKLPAYVKWLGYLDDDLMPCLIKSLDVLISVNLDSSFGNYSYPVKLYEAIQARTPVVATSTASVDWVLSDHQDLLVPVSNPTKLAEKILHVLSMDRIEYRQHDTWEELAGKLGQLMQARL